MEPEELEVLLNLLKRKGMYDAAERLETLFGADETDVH